MVRDSIYGASLQQLGDVILTVGGRKVANTDDLQNALQDKKPGETVDLEILRQGKRVTVPVRLSERLILCAEALLIRCIISAKLKKLFPSYNGVKAKWT